MAGWSVLRVAGPVDAIGGHGDDTAVQWADECPTDDNTYPGRPTDVVLRWEDQPAPIPPPAEDVVGSLLEWEALSTRLTPSDNFFTVKHYNLPELDRASWRLAIDGLVTRPATLSLSDLRSRPRRRVEFALECSGNTGLPFFIGGIGNAVWGGAQLAPVLRRAGILDRASEVVFWGADAGTVTIRDNAGVTGPGMTGTVEPDEGGGLDLTITEHFARSMSVHDALAPGNLLCYEMNGDALPADHGGPVRLIAPGWYGVANVKWLTHVEITDRRFTGRFMARDYVTIREETDATGQTIWTFTNVGQDRLKSAPAKIVRRGNRYTTIGVAWGAPIAGVDVSIDGGAWSERRCTAQIARRTPGGSGRTTAVRSLLGATPSRRGPSARTTTSNQRRTAPTSPRGGPIGRTTATSLARSTSSSFSGPANRPVSSGQRHARDGRPRPSRRPRTEHEYDPLSAAGTTVTGFLPPLAPVPPGCRVSSVGRALDL